MDSNSSTSGDSIDSIQSVDSIDSIDSIQSVDSIDSIDSIQSVDSIDSIDSIQSVDSIDSVDSVDSIDSIPSVDSIDSIDSVQSVDSVDSVASVESVESIDSVDSISSVESIDSVSSVNSIDSIPSVDSIDSIDSIASLDSINSVSSVDSIESLDSIASVSSLESIESISSVDSVDSVESIDSQDDTVPEEETAGTDDNDDDDDDEDDDDEPCSECPCPCNDGLAGPDSGGINPDVYTTAPVRYFDGSIRLKIADLESNGFGFRWGHERSYNNRITNNAIGDNGNSWFVSQMPRIVQFTSNSPSPEMALRGAGMRAARFGTFAEGAGVEMVGVFGGGGKLSMDNPRYFKKGSAGEFSGRFGIKSTLQATSSGGLVMHSPRGRQTAFHGPDEGAISNGFKGISGPGGQFFPATHDESGRLSSFLQSDGTSSCEYVYSYLDGGSNEGQLGTVTLKINGTPVRRCVYTYYEDGSFGLLHDLRTAKVEQFAPTTTSWFELKTSYYRYYVDREGSGFAHGLKFALEPESYSLLIRDGLNPDTATDEQLADYANYYFEYDETKRVVLERTHGGKYTYTLSYDNSSFPAGYNTWSVRTTETLPDGNVNVVYSNFAGQVIFKIRRAGTDEWYEYYRYSDAARCILGATSAAVDSYDEAEPELVTLKASEGLIKINNYYEAGDPSSGAAPNYLHYRAVKEGAEGDEIKLEELEYISRSAGDVTVYKVGQQTRYQSDTDGGSDPVVTQTTYSWFSGKVLPQSVSTILPAVPEIQNGSGVSNQIDEVMDAYGRRRWFRNERGYITGTIRDLATGAIVQRIDDVDTSLYSDLPSGWTTPSGGGLNLISDYEWDLLGRVTQELQPWHEIDLEGVATNIRRAVWTVYRDDIGQEWVGKGYATDADPGYTCTLINPVSITRRDDADRVIANIEGVRSGGSGRLQPDDSIPQTGWSRWRTRTYNKQGEAYFGTIYFDIPTSGTGGKDVNFIELYFGYDSVGRVIRSTTGGGTIARSVFNPMGWIIESWVGTEDNGATDSNPGGTGMGNNMRKFRSLFYDGDAAKGNGNLTQESLWLDDTHSRVTTYAYDFRNRRVALDGELDLYFEYALDNLDRITRIDQKDTGPTGTLVGRSEKHYDVLGRVYQSSQFGVDPTMGIVGTAISELSWFDPAGNVIKLRPYGSEAFWKSSFDGVNRFTARYAGHGPGDTYATAGSVEADTIVDQQEFVYDDGGNIISRKLRLRFDDATGTGPLSTPDGAQPKARVMHEAWWPDPLGRNSNYANYGTNAATSWTRPSTAPARSDTVLVTSNEYNDRGEHVVRERPTGRRDRKGFDDMGRVILQIANEVPEGTDPDSNVTTTFTFSLDSKVATITGVNSDTGDQVTQFIYGTTLEDGPIASSSLLRQKIYPDGASFSYTYLYNRQGERIAASDPNETTHNFDYDLLGRRIHDRAFLVSSLVDASVLRISRTYNARGLLEKITSYDNATVGSGTIVNEVKLTYNNFRQLEEDYQSHSGAVGSETEKVSYDYEDGGANSVRRTGVLYPDGTTAISTGYEGATADALSRPNQITQSENVLASYRYLGADICVGITYEAANDVELTYESAVDPGGAGDKYTGLDRFGRLIETRWLRESEALVHSQYGRNRFGGAIWRYDAKAHSLTPPVTTEDAFYQYDGLYQVKQHQRGDLAGSFPDYTGITVPDQQEDFGYDPTGNWLDYSSLVPANVQSRTHNAANQITEISATVGDVSPLYDGAGNMRTMPVTPGISTAAYTLKWDAWNRLISVTDGETLVASHSYDGLHRRQTKMVPASDEFRHYYYNNEWRVVEERLEGSTTLVDQQYTWGPRGRWDLVRRVRSLTGLLDESLFVLVDNSDPVALVDTDGLIVERYSYDAFGRADALSPEFVRLLASAYEWTFLFHTEQLDVETGLYNYGYRYYSVSLGRWLSRDEIEEADSFNLYLFLQNRPGDGVDLHGKIFLLLAPFVPVIALALLILVIVIIYQESQHEYGNHGHGEGDDGSGDDPKFKRNEYPIPNDGHTHNHPPEIPDDKNRGGRPRGLQEGEPYYPRNPRPYCPPMGPIRGR